MFRPLLAEIYEGALIVIVNKKDPMYMCAEILYLKCAYECNKL